MSLSSPVALAIIAAIKYNALILLIHGHSNNTKVSFFTKVSLSLSCDACTDFGHVSDRPMHASSSSHHKQHSIIKCESFHIRNQMPPYTHTHTHTHPSAQKLKKKNHKHPSTQCDSIKKKKCFRRGTSLVVLHHHVFTRLIFVWWCIRRYDNSGTPLELFTNLVNTHLIQFIATQPWTRRKPRSSKAEKMSTVGHHEHDRDRYQHSDDEQIRELENEAEMEMEKFRLEGRVIHDDGHVKNGREKDALAKIGQQERREKQRSVGSSEQEYKGHLKKVCMCVHACMHVCKCVCMCV